MNEEQTIKVKVIEVTYNRINNLFTMKVESIENQKSHTMAILGDDWGVNNKVSDEVINKFCEDMRGRIKDINIIVEDDTDEIVSMIDNKPSVSTFSLQHGHDNLDKYPLYEIEQMIREENDKD